MLFLKGAPQAGRGYGEGGLKRIPVRSGWNAVTTLLSGVSKSTSQSEECWRVALGQLLSTT
jgi:hypothetical protein